MDSQAWKLAVVDMVRLLQQMAEVDVDRLWEYHLPELAATPEQLAAVEQHLGECIDSTYRAFLEVAAGWRCAYQRVDLFGPGDLVGGERMTRALRLLQELEDGVLVDSGYRRDQLLPIACSSVNLDLFVITRLASRSPGTVIWYNGREIYRYKDFDEFFLAMMEYNRLEAEDLKAENGLR